MSTLINTMYSKGQSIAAIAQMTGLPVDKVSYFINLSANE
jgi:hypothetical protein